MAPTTPTSTSSDKPFGISQIRAYIPIILDLEKMNYDVWRELFETHCLTFGVLEHLDGTTAATPDTEKVWKERDGLVKMWIYATIIDSLTETILKSKSTARDLWLALENQFRDNKESRALQLENELRTITIGDLTVQEYCRKLKTLSNLLANVDSPVSDRALVMHCLNGLNEKFDGIHNVIRHRSPFPSFTTTRSMLQSEEDCLKKQVRPPATPAATASSPTVHNADQPPSTNYTNRGNHNKHKGRGGGRGNCGRGRHNNNSGHFLPGSYGSQPVSYPPSQWNYNAPPWPYPYYPSPYPYQQQFAPPTRPHTGFPSYAPHPQAHLVQDGTGDTSSSALVPTALAHAFNTMTLQDPVVTLWVMDTGATAHVTSQPGNLTTVFNKSITPSVIVGNGSLAPVTNSGHGTLLTPSRALQLQNVLVCPSFVQNLISVRRFVTDNICTIEFDPFGFSIKDLPTKQTLLRCDSPGPLYSKTPTTQPSPPLALTLGSSLWHRRLGHPGSSVQRSLHSFGFNKADITSVCHACRLGKHSRLPIYSSSTVVTEPFDIVHSDIWTSPVLSNSGFKYYLLFMDDFSHFIWNGRAESMLRTINNLLRTFLIQAHMPYTFWVEALLASAHTLNLLPSSSINNLTPFSRLFNKPQTYDHLRVFRCLCYPNVLSTAPHKLAPRSVACVFLGYPANHRGYRCLDIASRKILLSRHVVFVENVFPFSQLPPPNTPKPVPLLPPPIPPSRPVPSPSDGIPSPSALPP
ncbi:PREDICTED: uncharacterized protein LOC104773550 [Camelina sativa]|uniref:Uncharacterized protein LOC104773550 n=1 Tax=Camelina sativa TaxID=90675 RepID=A0ABM0Y6X6_CAMSA|nr:PREDICTED: uncharacterized protein LOC104773550 [Camelina sativa]